MLKKSLFFVVLALFWTNVFVAAQQSSPTAVLTAQQPKLQPNKAVKNLELDSKLMTRKMPYAVILPSSYETDKTRRFPTVYLLHGLSGHHNDWLRDNNFVNYISQNHQFVVILVEGDNGWYVNSAQNQNDRYESYIIEELIPEIDKNFRTAENKKMRAVAGFSMGGYGSLKFGLKYPNKFAFVGSMSGALGAAGYSTGLMTSSWDFIKTSLETAFGANDSDARKSNDIFALVKTLTADQKNQLPFLYLDCGTEDFLIGDNRNFAALLLEKKIPHEFRQLPGAHNWQYWNKQGVEILRELDQVFARSTIPTSAANSTVK